MNTANILHMRYGDDTFDCVTYFDCVKSPKVQQPAGRKKQRGKQVEYPQKGKAA